MRISTSRVSACLVVLMCHDFRHVGNALSPNEDVIQVQKLHRQTQHFNAIQHCVSLSVRQNQHRAPLLRQFKSISTFTACNSFVSEISLIFDMIYLSTAVVLTPGGSSTVHIYTQTRHRTTQ